MIEPIVRVATLADAEACNAFHNEHQADVRTLAQWRWEFGRSPNARGELPFVLAESKGRIVGTQALIEVPFLDARGRFLTAKSEETLIAPEMRGRDLLDAMYSRLFDIARDRGVRWIWGFTPAEGAFRRVGFNVSARTRQLLHPISPDVAVMLAGAGTSGLRRHALRGAGLGAAVATAVVRSVRGVRPAGHRGSAIVVQAPGDIPEEVGTLTEAFVHQWGGTTVLRDKPFLDWRITTNPYVRACSLSATWQGRLVGYCAVALGPDGMGYVVDILAADASGDRALAARAVATLLDHAVRRLRDMGALAVRVWRVGRHPFERVVTRGCLAAGFLPVDRGSAVVVHTDFACAPVPTTLDEWYVTRLNTEGRLG